MEKLKAKLHKFNGNAEQGFTLLEILVVLTIMGFLIAMVAPRLANLSDNAGETVCNTSKSRNKTYLSSFFEKYNRYPNMLTNMVVADNGVNYQVAPCSNDDPDDGPEVLALGHNKMYKFYIHHIIASEAQELIDLGITKVLNLNDYSGLVDDGAGGYLAADGRDGGSFDDVSNWADIAAIAAPRPSSEIVDVEAGLGVLMSGCGVADAGTPGTFATCPSERAWAEENTFARIIFAMGPESELVTSGIVTNAAHCPGSIQNADNFTFGGYYLILPRLEATAARLKDAATTFASTWGASPLLGGLQSLTAISWPKAGPKPSTNYDMAGNADNFKIRELNLVAPQEAWEYLTNRNRNDEIWGLNLHGPGVDILQGG